MKCENKQDGCTKDAVEVLRLTSIHSHVQNPMRLGSRVPARIVVCNECAEYLCNDSQLKWKSEGKYTGEKNFRGDFSLTTALENKNEN
jgi:hypothetical protein